MLTGSLVLTISLWLRLSPVKRWIYVCGNCITETELYLSMAYCMHACWPRFSRLLLLLCHRNHNRRLLLPVHTESIVSWLYDATRRVGRIRMETMPCQRIAVSSCARKCLVVSSVCVFASATLCISVGCNAQQQILLALFLCCFVEIVVSFTLEFTWLKSRLTSFSLLCFRLLSICYTYKILLTIICQLRNVCHPRSPREWRSLKVSR